MNEKGSKRREWVKTAAIIFLSIMLVLTFFSNTIMNYSLPEVATQYVQSGTITAKIRGVGVVESGDPYNVEVKESRKVASVPVRVGDEVQKGEVLFYLEDEESDELKRAQEALESAQDAYRKALLSTDLTESDIQAAVAGATTEGYRQQITARQNAITAAENALKMAENAVTAAENDVETAQKKVEEIQERYDAFDLQISIEQSKTVDTSAETAALNAANAELEQAKNAKTAAEIYLTACDNRVSEIQDALDLYGDVDGLGEQLFLAQEAQNQAQADYNNALLEERIKQEAVNRAQDALQAKQDSFSVADTIANLRNQQSYVAVELRNAQKVVTDKQKIVEQRREDVTLKQEALADRKTELTELETSIGRVTGLQSYQDAIEKAQAEVDKLAADTIGATITAPISGTITTLNVIAGQTTSPGVPVAVMQPEGQGYTMSFSVTNEQAQRLSVGDVAELVNSWRYGDITVTLASIKVDTNNPSQNKLLTFDVKGSSVVAGQSLSVSVGQKSANYDYIVPNSAIREDNNGKFVLIVQAKSSPLGTRYYASRVDVEVITSDDTQSAVSGAINSYDYVITTSTKPVEAGNLVRLND